jgi:glycine/D-amino acid oxidase-like deaminating enzyme
VTADTDVSLGGPASVWQHTLPPEDRGAPRPPLGGDTTADVCIVGAGYTGLWTAYYLSCADPSLDVVLLDARTAGFGASGRNGGWCSALLPQSVDAMAPRHGADASLAMRRTMQRSVDEVGEVARTEGIDCHWHKGGTVVVARTPAQLARARAEVAHDRRWRGIDGLQLLDGAQVRERLTVPDALGGTWTPHCAVLHPARLARGLARVVERRGVRVHENTRALELRSGQVRTDRGTVRARHVVRATEAWTAQLPGSRRELVPVYSLVIATAPLPQAVWSRLGLRDRETFSEHRHVIVYGQRTADDRLVFGGRGAPYHYGSAVRPTYDTKARVFATLDRALAELLPDGAPYDVTHRWGGPLAISRDWHASVRFDPRTGLASAGGYVGDGVASANLAGRTLADLLLGRTSALTRLPWVGHTSPQWEPEPLRWLGVNAGLRIAAAADATEARSGQATPASRALSGLLGRLTGS